MKKPSPPQSTANKKPLLTPAAWQAAMPPGNLPLKAAPTLEQARDAARASAWLFPQPGHIQEALLGESTLQKFDKNQKIINFEDQGSNLYFLVQGSVEVGMARPRAGGRLFPVHIVTSLNWFGEHGAVTGKASFAEFRARSACSALVIDRAALQALAAQDASIQQVLLELLSGAIRSYLELAGDVSGLDVEDRVRSKLFALSASAPPATDGKGVDIPMSREELAIVASVSRASACNVLSSLQDAGVVKLGYRRITVLRRDELLAPKPDC
jgi:CRP-like cAMP-binding protein